MPSAQGMRYVMGTFLSIHVQGTDESEARQARDLMFNEIQRLEALLSIYRPDSEISHINQAAGVMPVCVSPSTCDVIREALRYAHLTSGAFDPTLGRPANYRHVLLNPEQRTVFLSVPGMRLDLGGIGKGFALDRALDGVRALFSLTKLTLDFGGQLLFWTPGGTFDLVTVAIEDPENRNAILSTLQIRTSGSLSTSSNAEHTGHLQDPRTGRPADRMASVTILASTGTEAEALSTALFVMDPWEADALLAQCPGVQAHVFRRRENGCAPAARQSQ